MIRLYSTGPDETAHKLPMDEPFARIPHSMCGDEELSDSAYRTFGGIMYWAKGKGVTNATDTEIGRHCGKKSRTSVARDIAELETKGRITRVTRGPLRTITVLVQFTGTAESAPKTGRSSAPDLILKRTPDGAQEDRNRGASAPDPGRLYGEGEKPRSGRRPRPAGAVVGGPTPPAAGEKRTGRRRAPSRDQLPLATRDDILSNEDFAAAQLVASKGTGPAQAVAQLSLIQHNRACAAMSQEPGSGPAGGSIRATPATRPAQQEEQLPALGSAAEVIEYFTASGWLGKPEGNPLREIAEKRVQAAREKEAKAKEQHP